MIKNQELKSDRTAGNDSRFANFYRDLPPKSNSLIRLFERGNGEYYCVYGDDALFVSDKFYKTSTVLKYIGDDSSKLPMCTLSQLNMASLLKMLVIEDLYSVEFWAMDNRGSAKWNVIKKATPTNFKDVEEILFSNSDITSSVVLVAHLEPSTVGSEIGVGVAYTDTISSTSIAMSEFIDDDTLSSLESMIVQASVKECVVSDCLNDLIAKRVRHLCMRCNTKLTVVPKAHFSKNNLEQDLNRLLDVEFNITASNVYAMSRAMYAVACLITLFSLTSYEENYKKYDIFCSNIQDSMRLDASALKALNMFDNNKSSSGSSLYKILNLCKTPQGSRLLAQWLKQPLVDVAEIEKRYDLIDVFYRDPISKQILRDQVLSKITDLYRFVKLFSRKNQHLQDIVRLYQVVKMLPELAKTLAEVDTCHKQLVDAEFLSELDKSIEGLAPLCSMVESTVDLQAAENHEFVIKPDFDPRLRELRSSIKQLKTEIESEAVSVANKLGIEYERKLKLENSSQYGYCLRLSRKDATSIRGDRDYVEYTTKKDGVYFTTSRISALSRKIGDISSEYGRLQSSLVKEIFVVAASYCPVLTTLNHLLARIDVLSSLAHASALAPIPYVRPKIHPKGAGTIRLKAARHPCVEILTNSFISNDVDISKENGTFIVITGPNMGGKSTYIRMVGVICLMAQIGCYVPAMDAEVSVLDSIMTRIGAWDNQLKSVSTFMVEMLEMSSITKHSTENSLIIIDELGRGTSTYDGFGLAYAISEHIITKIKAPTLIATHYHELTKLDEHYPSVSNYHASVVNEENEIVILYKILPGPSDRSFGIHAAVLAGFPESIIKLANIKAAELESFSKDSTLCPLLNETQTKEVTDFVESLVSEILGCESIASDKCVLETRLLEIRDKYLGIAQSSDHLRQALSTV